MRCALLLLSSLLFTACSQGRLAATLPQPPAADVEPLLAQSIAKRFDVPVDHVRRSEVTDLIEVRNGAEVLYVSDDGRFLIRGDVTDLNSGREITEERRRVARLAALRELPAGAIIDFKPAPPLQPRFTVTVFTDIDCPYCQAVHNHLDEYLADGIAIRYVAYPRSGPDTASWYAAESTWCAPNAQDAFLHSFAGASSRKPNLQCQPLIAAGFDTGKQIGVIGTPTLVLPSGTLLPGYQTPEKLLQRLIQDAQLPPLEDAPHDAQKLAG